MLEGVDALWLRWDRMGRTGERRETNNEPNFQMGLTSDSSLSWREFIYIQSTYYHIKGMSAELRHGKNGKAMKVTRLK